MSKWRVWIVMAGACLVACYILYCGSVTMFTQADYWRGVKERFGRDSVVIAPMRGNILACDSSVMVASVPKYDLRMDFVVIEKDSVKRTKAQQWRDSVLTQYIDTIAQGLARIFPDVKEQWFRDNLLRGREQGSHYWRVCPRLANYNEYKACKELPLFREPFYRGGFLAEENMQRRKLYGSLASKTVGNLAASEGQNTTGLEWCYDSIMRGTPGYGHVSRVRGRRLQTIDQPPQHGHDLLTTIDPRMQDIAEKAMLEQLHSVEGSEKGVAILMEAATGDVKALVTLSRNAADGEFYEMQNDAINALWEPGSTFKTGSLMVAMEDGYITPDTHVYCDNGICKMHGRNMTDHNLARGGYQDLTVTEVLGYSSNIGVSKLIDRYYHSQPEKFVQGLYNLGVGIDYGLPMGSNPRVRMPQPGWKHKGGWSETALAWMSIGYETQLTPLNTLIFYNAIANNGRMVRPRFVTAEMADGQVVREFPIEVIKEKICSDRTLRWTQGMLEKVVSQGLGKQAGNPKFKVSGKTGTAKVAENGSYAGRKYMVSFCGYFPSDQPQYSCIVCIYKYGLPASGGGQCGPVFSRISQAVMNKGEAHPLTLTTDTAAILTAPQVDGRGAKDAVAALLQAGYSVKVKGHGRVKEQRTEGKQVTLYLVDE